MSKSLGNFVTIHELLETEKFGGRKWPGEVLRLAILKTHYRQPIDWTTRALEEASSNLRSLLAAWRFPDIEASVDESEDVERDFLEALSNDLNTPRAVGLLLEGATSLGTKKLTGLAQLLGIDFVSYDLLEKQQSQLARGDEFRVNTLISQRLDARKAKNWAESDRIRDELSAMGIAIKDNKDGTTSWEVKR